MGVDASPRSISPQRTGDEFIRLPPLMGQQLREAIIHRTHRVILASSHDKPYATHEIIGVAAVTSEVMLFTLNMRTGGNCYALFPFQFETIFSGGNGIFMRRDAIESDHVTGVFQGIGADSQRRNPQG